MLSKYTCFTIMQKGKTYASHKKPLRPNQLGMHQKISDAREQSGLTTAQYITQLLTEYYEMKENGGNTAMTNNKSRTLAFQIDENLFQRIKAHLERETQRTGRNLTQREFVLGLVEATLDEAESGRPQRTALSLRWRNSPAREPVSAPVRPSRRAAAPSPRGWRSRRVERAAGRVRPRQPNSR